MYNQPYFIPGYFPSSIAPSMMRSGIGSAMNGAMNGARFGTMSNVMNGARLGAKGASKGLGLFGRLGNSFSAIKNVNWGGLITNTSKTLNVVNQAIPLVRQVGPMVNNMKSMLRVASIFKDETDKKPMRQRTKNSSFSNSTTQNTSNAYIYSQVNTNSKNVNNSQNRSTNSLNNENVNQVHSDNYDSSPTFFVSS